MGTANKCVEVYLANNQANHKGKKYIKWGKNVCSLLGKVLNVSNRGTFGFVRIKDVVGLLGAAQNADEKRLSPFHRVSELVGGCDWWCEACAQHGQILWAGSLASCSPQRCSRPWSGNS